MSQQIVQVDSFASKPFAGNPAAVCIMESAADEDWMQSVALEMNLSETAFLYPVADGYNLRWFTPGAEVNLCGHATLASAHVLWEGGHLPADSMARFHTKSGILTAVFKDGWIELNFPSIEAIETGIPAELVDALGIAPQHVCEVEDEYLAELESGEDVRTLKPDFTALTKLDVRGVIVTGQSDSSEYDFISRFFAPKIGVNEDPVTGSAHCVLAPYWSKKLNKTDLIAYQASARGGELKLRLSDDRVLIQGLAITVMRGELV